MSRVVSTQRSVPMGGEGRPAVLVPANGFPLPAYRRFAEALGERLSVSGLVLRPMWGEREPDRTVQWSTLGDDLLAAMKELEEPPIVVGHSLGATAAILATARAPERFAGLVVIEPAMVSRVIHFAMRLLPYDVRQRYVRLISSTLRRPDAWDDRAQFLRHAARNPVYRSLDDAAMQDLADGLLEPHDGGVRLTYSKRWEAHFYSTAPWPIPAARRIQSVPVFGLRGAPSMFLSSSLWSQLQAALPRAEFRALNDYGHLLPIEAPDACATEVLEALERRSLL